MRIEHGDMREVLGKMVAEGKTVQSVVTDPPYHLTSIVAHVRGDDTPLFRETSQEVLL